MSRLLVTTSTSSHILASVWYETTSQPIWPSHSGLGKKVVWHGSVLLRYRVKKVSLPFAVE